MGISAWLPSSTVYYSLNVCVVDVCIIEIIVLERCVRLYNMLYNFYDRLNLHVVKNTTCITTITAI